MRGFPLKKRQVKQVKLRRRPAVSSMILISAVVIVVLIVAAAALYAFALSGNHSTSTTTNTTATTSSFALTYTDTQSLTINAGGSSFVNPVMQQWAFALAHLSDAVAMVNYQPLGSEAGQQGLFDGSFAFAGSDVPVTQAQLANYSGKTLLQIPETLGAVAIFYNIPQIGNVSLRFTGPVLAAVYNETITKWNDPAITALNPSVTFPNQTIIPVHRSDGSGTTYAFTSYLSRIDPSWNSTVGVGLLANWPANELGGDTSSGVSTIVYTTPYTIGYVDQYDAAYNNVSIASIENSSGNFILPTLTSIEDAASDYSSQLATNPLYSITDAPGAQSYPISTFTYLLVWKDQTDPNVAYAIANFFWYIVNYGQTVGKDFYFPSIPQSMVGVDDNIIAQINYNGHTYFTPSGPVT